MKRYKVIKDGFETIIQADILQTSVESGQTLFWLKGEGKENPIAIIPKECIIIETEDWTPLQKVVSELRERFLKEAGFSDLERKLPDFNTLESWKQEVRTGLFHQFDELLTKISNP